MNRLQVVASLEPDTQGRALESYLGSPAFVGRAAERDAIRRALASAASARPSTVIVTGAPGVGRTRLLSEMALEARLEGAVVLQAEPHSHRSTLGVAQDFALRLLAALPVEALAAAAPYARTLGWCRLGFETSSSSRPEISRDAQAHGEARMRVQAALRDLVLACAPPPMVIVADDLEAFDEASAAWLARSHARRRPTG